MRLRQIVFAAQDLDRVEADLAAVFGWQVAFRDPIVAKWDLRNAVIPIGNNFLEIVSPLKEGTAAGRHMARIGGDGGYMVMFQVPDRDAQTKRLEKAGVRVAYRSDQKTYCLTQFHPGDCGGLIMAWEQVLHPDGADWSQPDGYWHAANGNEWHKHVVKTRVGEISRVVLQGPSATALAETYAKLLDKPIDPTGKLPTIHLATEDLGFADRNSASPIAAVELETVDAETTLTAARERGLPVDGNDILISGVIFRLL